MKPSRLVRAVAVLGVGFLLSFAVTQPASANGEDVVIDLNPEQRYLSAVEIGKHGCDLIPGGASAQYDGWVLELPNDAKYINISVGAHVGSGPPEDGNYWGFEISATDPEEDPRFPYGIVGENGATKLWIQSPAGAVQFHMVRVALDGPTVSRYVNVIYACPAGWTPPLGSINDAATDLGGRSWSCFPGSSRLSQDSRHGAGGPGNPTNASVPTGATAAAARTTTVFGHRNGSGRAADELRTGP